MLTLAFSSAHRCSRYHFNIDLERRLPSSYRSIRTYTQSRYICTHMAHIADLYLSPISSSPLGSRFKSTFLILFPQQNLLLLVHHLLLSSRTREMGGPSRRDNCCCDIVQKVEDGEGFEAVLDLSIEHSSSCCRNAYKR